MADDPFDYNALVLADVRRRQALGEQIPEELQPFTAVEPAPADPGLAGAPLDGGGAAPAAPAAAPTPAPAEPTYANDYYREMDQIARAQYGASLSTLSPEAREAVRKAYIGDRSQYAVPGAPDSASERRAWLYTQLADPSVPEGAAIYDGIGAVPQTPEAAQPLTMQQQIEAADAESGTVAGAVSLGGTVVSTATEAAADTLVFGLDAIDWAADRLAIGAAMGFEAVGVSLDGEGAEGYTDRVRQRTEMQGAGGVAIEDHRAITDAIQGGGRTAGQFITDVTQTEGDRLRQQAVSTYIQQGDMAGLAGFIRENPYSIINGTAQAAGYVVGAGGVVGMARKGAVRLGGRAVISTADDAAAAALASGAKAAAPATTAVGRTLRAYGGRTRDIVAGGGGAAASGARYQAEQSFRQMTDQDLYAMPEYAQVRAMLRDASGEEPTNDQVRDVMARRAGQTAFEYGLAAAPLAALIPGSASVERSLLNAFTRVTANGGARGAIRGGLSGVVREGASEFVEEYTTAVGEGRAGVINYHPSVEGIVPQVRDAIGAMLEFDDVAVTQGVYGAILGSAMGGAVGVRQGLANKADPNAGGETETPPAPITRPELSDAEARVFVSAAQSGQSKAEGVPDSFLMTSAAYQRAGGGELDADGARYLHAVTSVVEQIGQREGATPEQVASALEIAATSYAQGKQAKSEVDPNAGLEEYHSNYEFKLPEGLDPSSKLALEAMMTGDSDTIAVHQFSNRVIASQINVTHQAELGENPVFGRQAAHHAWAVDAAVPGETTMFSDEDRRVVMLADGKMLSYTKGNDSPISEADAATAEAGSPLEAEARALRGIASYVRTARGMDTGLHDVSSGPVEDETPLSQTLNPTERWIAALSGDVYPADMLGEALEASRTMVGFRQFMDAHGVSAADAAQIGLFTETEMTASLETPESMGLDPSSPEAGQLRERIKQAVRRRTAKELTSKLTAAVGNETLPRETRAAASRLLNMQKAADAAPEPVPTNDFGQPVRAERNPVEKRLRASANAEATYPKRSPNEGIERARMSWLANRINAARHAGQDVSSLEKHAGFEEAAQMADVIGNTANTPARAEAGLRDAETALEVAVKASSPDAAARTAKPRGKGLNPIQAGDLRTRFERDWSGSNVRLEFHDSEAKVPVDVKGTRSGFQALIQMTPDGSGTIHMVRDQIGSKAEAERIITHELVGHYGMENLVGREGIMILYRRLQTVRNTNQSVANIFAEVEQSYPGISQQEMAQEVIARAADLREDNSALTDMAGTLRKGLHDMGMPIAAKGPVREVIDLFRDAGDMLRRGEAVYKSDGDTQVLQARRAVQGVMSEGQTRGHLTRSAERAENRGQRLLQDTWAERNIHTKWFDKAGRIARVQRYLRDRIGGAPLAENQDVYSGLKNMMTKAGVNYNLDEAETVRPFETAIAELAKKTGRTVENLTANFGLYISRKHAIERNKVFYLINTPLKTDAARGERAALMNAVHDGTISPSEGLRQLTKLVDANADGGLTPIEAARADMQRRNDDDLAAKRITPAEAKARMKAAIEDAKKNGAPDAVRSQHLASMSLSGIKTSDAEQTIAAFEADGMAVHMEALVPLWQNITERTRARNREAGLYGKGADRIMEMYGFQYYTPLKGLVESEQVNEVQAAAIKTIEWETGDAAYNGFNAKAAAAGGRQTDAAQADSPVMVAIADLQAANRRVAMNGVMGRLVNLASAHGEAFAASVGDAKAAVFTDDGKAGPHWKLPPSRSTRNNNAFTFYQDGKIQEIIIEDEAFANALLPPKQQNAIAAKIGQGTRTVGRFLTSRNPNFWSTQAMRDVQNVLYTVGGEKSPQLAAEIARNAFSVQNFNMARKFYYADPVGKETLFKENKDDKFVQHMYRRYKDGGHVFFSDQGSPLKMRQDYLKRTRRQAGEAPEWTRSNLGRHSPKLAEAVGTMVDRGVHGAETIFRVMDDTSGVMDNYLRDATYMALVENGVNKSEAGRYAREIADFNQQAENAAFMGNFFLFYQPFMIGTQRAVRTLFKGGEVPLKYVDNGDGTTSAAFDWSKKANVNWPLLGFHIAKGAATYAMAAAAMGQDDDGVDEISKLSGSTISANEIWGVTNDRGNPMRIPRQFGVQMVFEAAGSLIAAHQSGHKSWEEVTSSFTDVMITNFTPVMPSARTSEELGGIGSVRGAMLAVLPSLLRPMMEVVTNQNTFGNPIHSDPSAETYARDQGWSTTPTVWHETAQFLGDEIGIDLHPETLEHFTRSYMAGIATPIARLLDNEIARQDGYDVSSFDPTSQTGAISVLKWARDPEFHPRAEADRFSHQLQELMREANSFENEDDTAALTAAFQRDNPFYDEMVRIYRATVDSDRYNSEVSQLNRAIAKVRRENGPSRAEDVQRLIRERDELYLRFAEQARDLMGDTR